MKSAIAFLAVVSTAFLATGGGAMAQPKEKPKLSVDEQAKIFYDFTMKASRLSDLEVAVGRFAQGGDEKLQKKLLLMLLQNYASEKKTPLEGPPELVVVAPGEKLPKPEKGKVYLYHDLATEGGRCAWTAEKLLGLSSLPPIRATMNNEEKQKTRFQAYEAAIEAMTMQADFTKLSVEERSKYAASPLAPPSFLARLAHDPSPMIRLAVASNPQTPVQVLAVLASDPDQEVAKAASKNLFRTRMF